MSVRRRPFDVDVVYFRYLYKLGDPKAFAIINFVTNGFHSLTANELVHADCYMDYVGIQKYKSLRVPHRP